MMDERDLGETQILAALIGISEMIGNLPDLQEVLRTVVRIAPQLVKVDRCAIFLYEGMTKELVPLEVYCADEARAVPLRNVRIKISEVPKLTNKVLKQRLPAVIRDVPQDDTLPEALVRQLGIRSMLATPLIAKGDVRGMMTLDHTQTRHYFTSKEINVVMGIADQIAMALENHRLLQEINSMRHRYESALEELTDGLITIAEDFTLDEFNERSGHLLGLKPSDVGKPWTDVLHLEGEDGAVLSEEDLVAMVPKELGILSQPRRVQIRGVGGKPIKVILRIIPVPNASGKITKLVLVLRRIPVAKALMPAQRPRTEARDEGKAEELEQALRKF